MPCVAGGQQQPRAHRASASACRPGELRAAGDGEVEQLVQRRPVEDGTLRGALHLDEAAVAGAHHVHVAVPARTSSS